jgi:organic hydroperoxide reductase OsmC/OhrA
MAARSHRYQVGLEWTGNLGPGTRGYTAFSRDHVLTVPGHEAIMGSSDPAFRGDGTRWNPEQLLVAALAACHQLWYLHLCAEAGMVVVAYEDAAEGEMAEEADGAGQFTSVTLRPSLTIAAGSDPDKALALHQAASEKCFIARSMAFPVHHAAVIKRAPA